MTTVNSGHELMDVVRDAMTTENVRDMARLTQVSTSALYAIRRGKTKWPRDYTLFALGVILDLEITVTRRRRRR